MYLLLNHYRYLKKFGKNLSIQYTRVVYILIRMIHQAHLFNNEFIIIMIFRMFKYILEVHISKL